MLRDFPKEKRKRSRTSSNETINSFVRSTTSRWFSGPSTSANGSAPAESTDEPFGTPEQPPPAKRACKPSQKYGPSDSFVKNVTQRMTEFLPATITKWFSSPSSANGSTPQAETDSSTEDEALEPPPQPPPNKRTYPSTAGKSSNHYATSDINNTPETNPEETTEMPENTYITIVQSPPGRTTFRREAGCVSTPRRTMEEPDREEHTGSVAQITVSQIARSMQRKRKSLFGNDSASNDASLKSCVKITVKDREPCFKASLLGSPFYPGRTMYGGASSSLYLNQPNVKKRKTAVVQTTINADTSISSATRRVMDLLEHYSSPLIEAKRIPPYTGAPYARGGKDSSISSYKTQELHTALPGVASLLRLKQRHKLRDSMSGVRQIVASQSSTHPYPPSSTATSEKDKFTSKVKSRVSATRPKRGENIDEMPTPLELPSGGLVIDTTNLPKFSFTTSTPKQITTILGDTKPQTVTSKITQNKKPTAQSSETFKFASPIRLSDALPQNDQRKLEFTFGSPDRKVDRKIETVSSFIGASKESVSADWTCSDCWVNNNVRAEKCVCCRGDKPNAASAPATRKCSVCKVANSQLERDKCVNCDIRVVGEETLTLTGASSETVEWRCKDCWITNKSDADKCAACGGLQPDAKIENKAATSNAFKKKPTNLNSSNTIKSNIASKWRCNDCWVDNNNSIDKCVACGGAKPGAKPEATAPTNKINSLQDIAKSQSHKWECQSCLVRNDSDALKCVCCNGAKPGIIKESDKNMFNFGIIPNTKFKFGIEPTEQSASVEQSENTSQEKTSKKVESETNNNSLENTPTFTFTVPKKTKPANKSSTEVPKVQFTFGIPKQPTDSVDTAKPTFGKSVDTTSAGSDNNEKEQVVPKIVTSVEPAKSTAGTFAPPLATAVSLPTPLSTNPSVLTNPSLKEKKDVPVNSVSLPTTTAEAKPSFNFSTGTGIKLGGNMFAAPAAATSTVVTTPSLSIPTTTSSLKSEVGATTTATMFQLGSTTTGVAATLTGAAPLFSFGMAATPAGTKAKATPSQGFNFSFGSNNKSETPMFKPLPAFGATDSSTNKFALPAATSVVPSVTPGSVITENKALPTSNIFGSNLPKENMFMTPTSTANTGSAANLFASPSTTANTLTTPGTFSFGSSPFNATATPAPTFGSTASTNATPTFGARAATNAIPTFGASATSNTTPAFGINTSANATPKFGVPVQSNQPAFGAQTTPSIFGGNQPATAPAPTFGAATQSPFGLPNQNSNNQPSLFSNPAAAPSLFGGSSVANPSANLFGSPAANPAPAFGSSTPAFGAPAAATPAFGAPAAVPAFGAPGVAAPPAFGVVNSAIPSFKASSPAPAAAFSFGSPQQSSAVFGFGQQQPQPQQAGIYNFSAAAGASPLFNMGTGPSAGGPPNTAVRKIRKATRRSTTPR